MSDSTSDTFTPPLIYRLFFLYIEPLSALLGAYYAAFKPSTYLDLLSTRPTLTSNLGSGSGGESIDTPTLTTLYQLANLYLLFALNEHLVLSRSTSLKTWRTLLVGLLIADFGHLATMVPVARSKGIRGMEEMFVEFWTWNAMEWGSVGFVYVGALMRVSFLVWTGTGVGGSKREGVAKGVGLKEKKEK